jgi:hypothetical protein
MARLGLNNRGWRQTPWRSREATKESTKPWLMPLMLNQARQVEFRLSTRKQVIAIYWDLTQILQRKEAFLVLTIKILQKSQRILMTTGKVRL